MPAIKTEFACPACQVATGKTSQILADAGSIVCSVDATHRWNDTQAFLAMKPIMAFSAPAVQAAPPANQAKIEVSVPQRVKDALDARFGDKVNANVAAALAAFSEGDSIIVHQTDIDRIQQRVGERPTSSGEIYGMIFMLGEQAREAKQTMDYAQSQVKAYENMNPASVMVDLGSFYQIAVEKARDAGLPLKVWLERNLHTALEGSWF
jgi:hypothetical protein